MHNISNILKEKMLIIRNDDKIKNKGIHIK